MERQIIHLLLRVWDHRKIGLFRWSRLMARRLRLPMGAPACLRVQRACSRRPAIWIQRVTPTLTARSLWCCRNLFWAIQLPDSRLPACSAVFEPLHHRPYQVRVAPTKLFLTAPAQAATRCARPISVCQTRPRWRASPLTLIMVTNHSWCSSTAAVRPMPTRSTRLRVTHSTLETEATTSPRLRRSSFTHSLESVNSMCA